MSKRHPKGTKTWIPGRYETPNDKLQSQPAIDPEILARTSNSPPITPKGSSLGLTFFTRAPNHHGKGAMK